MTEEEIKYYLERIGFLDKPGTDLETLSRLQEHHLLAVPFENLDIHSKVPIEMDLQAFYNKIVVGKRGGFCYELNSLFNELLRGIGFKTNIVSARVFSAQEKFGEEFDHLCLIVFIENEQWLADVGFGSFSLRPIKIDMTGTTSDPAGLFKTERFNEQYLVVKKMVNGEWKNQYLFSLQPRNISEFSAMCYYQQTSPDSHFTKNRLCSIATMDGRISLTDRSLKITRNNIQTEMTIRDDEDFKKLLLEYFDIRL